MIIANNRWQGIRSVSRRARCWCDQRQVEWSERQVCSAPHHEPIKKQNDRESFIDVESEKLWCVNLMILFSSSTARNAFCNTGSSNRIAKSPWKCLYALRIVSMDKILRFTNTFIIFKMRQCSSSQIGFLRIHSSTQTSWNCSPVVFLRWPLLLATFLLLPRGSEDVC